MDMGRARAEAGWASGGEVCAQPVAKGRGGAGPGRPPSSTGRPAGGHQHYVSLQGLLLAACGAGGWQHLNSGAA